jgi:hypothetical protein
MENLNNKQKKEIDTWATILAPFLVVFYLFLLGMFMVILFRVGDFIAKLIW